MRVPRWVATGALAFFLAGVGALDGAAGVPAQAQQTQEPIRPIMTITKSGTLATFAILIQNDTRAEIGQYDIRATIPEGTTVTSSWAGVGPGNWPGQTAGPGVIGWIKPQVRAGGAEGPFVFTVESGGKRVCSYVYLQISSAGIYSKNVVTQPVCST